MTVRKENGKAELVKIANEEFKLLGIKETVDEFFLTDEVRKVICQEYIIMKAEVSEKFEVMPAVLRVRAEILFAEVCERDLYLQSVEGQYRIALGEAINFMQENENNSVFSVDEIMKQKSNLLNITDIRTVSRKVSNILKDTFWRTVSEYTAGYASKNLGVYKRLANMA